MPPTISVVIPTYNRRLLLEQTLESLNRQSVPAASFEVIVVADGATDETVEFLQRFSPPYPFQFHSRPKGGVAAARNYGIAKAAAEIVLCLDDDMVASSELLEQHLHSHKESPGGVVQGALLLHDSVLRTPFIRYEERRLNQFHQRQCAKPAMDGRDLAEGNLSLSIGLFRDIGGFDEELREYNDTDGDLGYRLQQRGIPMIYNGHALARMAHIKNFDERLRESQRYGRTYVRLQEKHPETIWQHSPLLTDRSSPLRNGMRLYLLRRAHQQWEFSGVERSLRWLIAAAEVVRIPFVAATAYRLAIDYYFWKGVHAESGGDVKRFVPRGIPILCYHNVSDRRLWRYRIYILPVHRFRRQVQWLVAHGYQAISLAQLEGYLRRGEPLPEKPVVITFDDGYQELASTAIPILAAHQLHHVHFINTGKMGGTTDWVTRAPDLPLLSAEAIGSLARQYGKGIDFQPHGHTHRDFSQITDAEAVAEILPCIESLGKIVQRPVVYFAYPYGEYKSSTPELMARQPIHAAFTVDQGLCRPGQSLQLLPRVEIFANDFMLDFISKVVFGWSPIASTRSWLKHQLKKVARMLWRQESAIAAKK